MESTKTDSKSFFFFFEMQDQKIKFWFADRKKYQKPEFLTEQLERGNFINLIS